MGEIKIFGEHDDRTKEQMARCMQHGSVVGGVLCADGHLGMPSRSAASSPMRSMCR